MRRAGGAPPAAAALLLGLGAFGAAAEPPPLEPPPPDPLPLFPLENEALPRNGQLVFIGTDVEDMTFARIAADGTATELAFARERVAEDLQVTYTIALSDVADLEPGALTVEARCEICSPRPLTYLVVDEADTAAPAFADAERAAPVVTTARGAGLGGLHFGYDIRLPLPAISEASTDRVLLRVDGDALGFAGMTPTEDPELALRVLGPDERTVCFTVSAVDVAGNEAALDDEVCAELRKDNIFGCAQAPSPAFGALFLALTALLGRRRRCGARETVRGPRAKLG